MMEDITALEAEIALLQEVENNENLKQVKKA